MPQFGAAAPEAWSFATEVIGQPIDYPGVRLKTFLLKITRELSPVATSSGDRQLLARNMLR